MTDVITPTTPDQPTGLGDKQRNVSAGSSRKHSAHRSRKVPSAVERWKKQHEQSMMERLVGLRNEKKEHTKLSKEQATNIARKIPTEILAKDWLNATEATLECRAYMVDKILPSLILGVEKLLNEADKRGLANNTEARDANFNPINFLAQYLMRNNPRYSNFSESSPYVRSIREVTEELKKELFNIEDNRLARIKAEARRRRDERERIEALKTKERQRREKALLEQFNVWCDEPHGQVSLHLLQNALRSFMEIIERYPITLREMARYSHPLESTDESGKALTVKDFAQYVVRHIEEFPVQVYDQFMMHMEKCARAYQNSTLRENRRIHLTNLFISCDHSGVGLLDRHRILSLFENFWDSVADDRKTLLRNPRKWPVVEVDEADDTLSDDAEEEEDEDEEDAEQTPSQGQVTEPASQTEQQAEEKPAGETEAQGQKPEATEEGSKPESAPATQETKPEEGLGEKEADEKKDETQQETQKEPEEKKEEKEGEAVEGKEKEAEEQKEQAEEQKEQTGEAKEQDGEAKEQDGEAKEQAEEAKEQAEEQKEQAAEQKEQAEEAKEQAEEQKEQAEEQKEQAGEAKEQIEEGKEEMKEEEKKEEKVEGEQQPAVEAEQGKEEKSEEPKQEEEKKEEEKEEVTMEKEAEAEPKEKTQEVTEMREGGTSMGTKPQEEVTVEAVPAPGSAPATGSVPASSAGKEKDDLEADVALTGDLLKGDPKTPATSDQQPVSVSFAEGTSFERDRTAMTTLSRTHSGLSAFDENVLTVSQFVQLTETFMGDGSGIKVFDDLKTYVKSEYQETEDEKMQRLIKARKEAMSSRRKMMLDQLFEKWDNDGSGYLDQDEVENVMLKYKDAQERDNIETAKVELKKKMKHPDDSRLSKREFRLFITTVGEKMPGADSFDYFIEFLNNSVERTYAERIRGEARKKWLQQIITAAETGGANIEPVYKAVFQALYKDAEAHGAGKNICANISMLERNVAEPERGDVCLRYVAATTEDADFLLSKVLHKDMLGISFSAVESGKPIHVPRVANHGNIQFWNPYRHPEEREGSFIVIPLKDRRKRVFGLLGVDTLNDRHTKSIFITHEIQFYQGVAKAFSIAYHNIDLRKKLLRITESAVSWIHRRSPHVKEITTYMVEPDEESKDYVLRKMMKTDKKGNIQSFSNPPRLERKDNLFRDYLFKAVDNSESVAADAYGERHLAFPLRNDQGHAVAIVDLSLGGKKSLPSHENREVQRMLRLLQLAHKEITKEMAGEDKTMVLEAEKDEDMRMDIMFDRLMLMELRENVTKIDSKAFAELRSYNDPPRIVHDILKAVCAIFNPEETESGAYDDWAQMKGQINNDLLQKIVTYDPTAGQKLISPERIERYLKEVPHGEVAKHSSVPAQHMYNWVFVCLSLIEHTLKMRENNTDNLMPQADIPTEAREARDVGSDENLIEANPVLFKV